MKPFVNFLKFGVSGSFPAASGNVPVYDPRSPYGCKMDRFDRFEFGGHTTTLVMEYYSGTEHRFIMIDQGSATSQAVDFLSGRMNDLGSAACSSLDIWFTHYHDDHTNGIAGNTLLFNPMVHTRFFNPELQQYRNEPLPPGVEGKLKEGVPGSQVMLTDYLINGDTWPLNVCKMMVGSNARRSHHIYNIGVKQRIDDAYTVDSLGLKHDRGCAGLRFNFPRVGSVVVATDHEPKLDPNPHVLAAFADGARYGLFDLQYSAFEEEGTLAVGHEKAMSRTGWGHGTPQELLKVLSLLTMGIDVIEFGHHDPKRNDAGLRRLEKQTVALMKGKVPCKKMAFARPGTIVFKAV